MLNSPIVGTRGAALLTLVAISHAGADIRLPPVFSDHMVIQRDQPVRVWGWADANAEVTVVVTDAANHADRQGTTTDANGRFELSLPAMPAGGPITLTIAQGEDQRVLGDVLIGDVWIAGGQSNMEWPMGRSEGAAEFTASANYPAIRAVRIGRASSTEPQNAAPTQGWRPCTPASAGAFSGVGLFFAADLHATLKDAAGNPVPIGIIECYHGGTPAEAWTPRPVLEATPEAADILSGWKEPGATPERSPEEIEQAQRALIDRLLSTRVPAEHGFDADSRENPGAGWTPASLPSAWPATLDGVMWYRTTILLTDAQAAAAGALMIPAIDDYDHAYINGALVGSTGPTTVDAWKAARRYPIPAGTLRAGENTIALRVLDAMGGGGVVGPADGFRLELTDAAPAPLAGPWMSRVVWNAADHGGFPAAAPVVREHLRPAGLYNAMLHPCVPFNVTGVIWYQGEGNAARAEQYRTLFPALITAWRDLFRNPEMPFLYVQLANHTARLEQPGESNWAELREAQALTLSLPNTAMVTAIDVGEAGDIHPRNKRDVGLRLAAEAKRMVYGQPDARGHGPRLASVDLAGPSAEVSFHFAEGLATRDGQPPRSFAVAGPDRQWHWADAALVTTPSGPRVRLTCPAVPVIEAVRYAWANNPDACLINAAGLPAEPFRTDDWPGVTTGKR